MDGKRDRWIALSGAIVVHLLLFAILGFGLNSSKAPPVSATVKPVIQASAVSEEKVMEPYRQRLAEEEAKKKHAAEKQEAAEEAKRRAKEEARRQADQERKAKEARRKAAEQKRLAEQKRKKEEEKARLAERERQRKIEAERKAAEAKKKAEAERKRQEAELELKKQMAAEAERLAQEQQRRHSLQMSRLQNQYVADITNKVQRNWLRPPESRGSYCRVVINQIPGGEIVGVKVADCDGDVPFKRSVEAAVRKASPLPLPPEPELFQREIEFVFRPAR